MTSTVVTDATRIPIWRAGYAQVLVLSIAFGGRSRHPVDWGTSGSCHAGRRTTRWGQSSRTGPCFCPTATPAIAFGVSADGSVVARPPAAFGPGTNKARLWPHSSAEILALAPTDESAPVGVRPVQAPMNALDHAEPSKAAPSSAVLPTRPAPGRDHQQRLLPPELRHAVASSFEAQRRAPTSRRSRHRGVPARPGRQRGCRPWTPAAGPLFTGEIPRQVSQRRRLAGASPKSSNTVRPSSSCVPMLAAFQSPCTRQCGLRQRGDQHSGGRPGAAAPPRPGAGATAGARPTGFGHHVLEHQRVRDPAPPLLQPRRARTSGSGPPAAMTRGVVACQPGGRRATAAMRSRWPRPAVAR